MSKILGLGLAVVLLAGLVAPQVQTDRYRGRIQGALESALGRQVTFGEVRFNLLTGPGFTVRDLTVAEEPGLGFEPVAYVDRVIATPRLLSLLTGQLAFSSLRLEDAHLNLARVDLPNGEYRWNLEPLLRPALVAAFPTLTIHGARINLKAANVKSVVYLLDCDLAIEPPSGEDLPWHFRFEGKPARADRTAHGSGILRARGTWKPGSLDADLQLERSELGDIVAVVRGEDAGLHGLISGSARFVGPLDRVAVNGRLRVEELHGWDQDVPKGEVWPLELQGHWNSPKQQLELDARVAAKGVSPVAVHYLVERYLTQPKWGVAVTLAHFPAAPLVPLARHMGVQLAPGFELGGTVDGVAGYSVAGGYGGQARIEHASLGMTGGKTLGADAAQILIADGTVRLLPTHLTDGDKQDADVTGEYTIATGASSLQITARELEVATVGRQIPGDRVPVLSEARAGWWSGELHWKQAAQKAGAWRGDLAVTDLELPSAALAKPVVLESAQVQLEGGRVAVTKMHGVAGLVAFGGEYRYEPEGAHPHRFRIAAAAVDADALEQLLLPTLARRRAVLGVALPFAKQTLPDWLAGWHAEGTIQIATLTSEEWKLNNVRARAVWDRGRIVMTDVVAGNVNGRVDLDIGGREPAYEITGRLRDQNWKGGKITVDARATGSGTGADLRRSLAATGVFRGSDLQEDVEQVSGRYEASWRGRVPQMALTGLRVHSGTESYTGKGSLQADGTLMLELESAGKLGRLTGSLGGDAPFRWLF